MSDTIDTLEAQNRKSKIAQAMKEYSSEGSGEASARRAKTREAIASEPESMTTPDDEKARRKAELLEMVPDSATAKQSMDFGDNAASITGLTPGFIANNADQVAKALYGPSDNSGSAGPKLDAAIKDAPLNQQINARWAQQMREGETQEGQQEIKDLQARRVSSGKGVWSFIVNVASGMVIQGQSLLRASVPPPIGGGKEAMDAYYQTQLKNSDELVGSMAGETYGSLREQGVSVKSAKAAAGVMIAAQVALNALSVSKVPGVGRAMEDLGKAGAKALASGQIAKAIGIQVGKGYAEQGAVAIVNNASSVIIPEFARLLDDDVKKGNITQPDAAEILKQFGEGVVLQTFVMGTISAATGAAGVGIAKRTKFAEEASKIANEAEKLPPEAQGKGKVAPEGGETGNPESEARSSLPADVAALELAKSRAAQAKLEADAKAAVAAMPAVDLDKPTPFEAPQSPNVPRGTGAELAKANEMPTLDKEVMEDPRVVAAKEQAPALQKAIDEEMAKPEPDQARVKALQDTLAADSNRVSHIENQVYQEKFTEQHPEVVAARQALEAAKMDPTQTDKVASLQEALDSAGKEANKMAAIRGATRVASERARVAAVNQRNKRIDNLKNIDLSKTPQEFKGPIEDIMSGVNLTKPTAKTLSALETIRKQIEDGTAPTTLPQKYVDRLGELSKKPFRDLTSEEQQIVHDTVMAYHHAGTEARMLVVNGIKRTQDEWNQQILGELETRHPTPFTKEQEAFEKSHPEMTREQIQKELSSFPEKISKAKKKAVHKQARQWYTSAQRSYQEMVAHVGGGEDSMLYQIAGRAVDMGDDVTHEKIYEYADPVKKWAEDKKVNLAKYLNEQRNVDVDGYHGPLERGQVIAMAGIQATHGNLDSLARFVLDNDTQKGRVYEVPPESLEKIIGTMDDTEKDFLNKVLETGKKTGGDMQPVFMKMFGYEYPEIDPYYPTQRHQANSTFEEDILKARANGLTHVGVDKSHLIERVESSKPMIVHNVGKDLQEMINSSSTYVGLGEPVRAASRVLYDEKIAAKIKAVHGEEFYNQMIKGLKSIAGEHQVFNTPERLVMNLRNKGIGAALGLNPRTVAVNAVLFERALGGYVPFRDWALGTANAIDHPIIVHKDLMENSAYYRELAEGGMTPEMAEAMRHTEGSAKAIEKARDVSMTPLKTVYTGAVRAEMEASRTQAYREIRSGKLSRDVARSMGLKEGDAPPKMTQEETKAAATKYAEYVAKRTHAGPREMYHQNVTREGILGTMMGTLMSEKNALLQTGMRLAMDVHKPGGKARFIKYLTVSVFGEAALIAAVTTGVAKGGVAVAKAITGKEPKKPEPTLGEEIERETLNNTIGGILGSSSFLYPLENLLSKKSGLPPTMSPGLVAQFGDDAFQVLGYVRTAMTAKSALARNKATWNAANSFLGLGIPLTTGLPYKHGIGDIFGYVQAGEEQP